MTALVSGARLAGFISFFDNAKIAAWLQSASDSLQHLIVLTKLVIRVNDEHSVELSSRQMRVIRRALDNFYLR